MYCRAIYDGHLSEMKYFSLTPDDHLCFKYSLKESDYYLPTTNQDFEQEDSLTRRTQSEIFNRSTSIIGPEVIHDMIVFLEFADSNLPLEILQYALINCPNLQKFWCDSHDDNFHTILLDAYLKTGNGIVKGIQNSPDTAQENIKVIRTENIVPSKELLCHIHQYLPAIERLVCLLDDMTNPHVGLFKVDLTAFIYLKLFQLAVQWFGDDSQNTACLEIQFSDKDWEYYHLRRSNPDLTVTKTTLELNERISSSEHGVIRKVIVKCRKHVKFELSFDASLATET
ncbi:hypothetical protein INT47_001261 [Mucor saturninus]|uniref:Uncharacterized protein n=1 Tax=Mucor saturninus TaxID=64648 RepID=A0A8H7RQH8_9FUNG|nr:hypothetical protein INT47_001261 [Mucor saturninus]